MTRANLTAELDARAEPSFYAESRACDKPGYRYRDYDSRPGTLAGGARLTLFWIGSVNRCRPGGDGLRTLDSAPVVARLRALLRGETAAGLARHPPDVVVFNSGMHDLSWHDPARGAGGGRAPRFRLSEYTERLQHAFALLSARPPLAAL